MTKEELSKLEQRFLNDKIRQSIIERIAEVHSKSFIGRYKDLNGEIKTVMDSNSEGLISILKKELEDYRIKNYPELK